VYKHQIFYYRRKLPQYPRLHQGLRRVGNLTLSPFSYAKTCPQKSKVKKAFDKSARKRDFIVGDTVLLWDKGREKPRKHGKFDSMWLGPYVIREIAGPNSFDLSHLDGEPINIPRNGQQLNLFFS
jgi:hypothetical protein